MLRRLTRRSAAMIFAFGGADGPVRVRSGDAQLEGVGSIQIGDGLQCGAGMNSRSTPRRRRT